MAAVAIRVDAAHDENPVHLDFLTSKVALEEPDIGSTDPNTPIANNCMDDNLHSGIPVDSGDYKDEGNESDECDAIPSSSRRHQAMTELERFDLRTSDVDRYEGEDGYDADAAEEEEASQADDGSTQNVEEWGHKWFDMATSDVDGYEGEDGNDEDADKEVEALRPNDASTQIVED